MTTTATNQGGSPKVSDYAKPDSIVSTDWVAEHLNDSKVRLIEVDVDTAAYDTGHAPGAVGWNWKSRPRDPRRPRHRRRGRHQRPALPGRR